MSQFSREQENYFRLSKLIIDVGSSCLRRVCKECWKKVVESDWDDQTSGIYFCENLISANDLNREAHLTEKIRQGNMDEWDIPTCSILLIKLFKKDERSETQKLNVSELKKHVQDLKRLRNFLQHAGRTEIKDADFKEKFEKAQQVLTDLGQPNLDYECKKIMTDHDNRLTALGGPLTQILDKYNHFMKTMLVQILAGQPNVPAQDGGRVETGDSVISVQPANICHPEIEFHHRSANAPSPANIAIPAFPGLDIVETGGDDINFDLLVSASCMKDLMKLSLAAMRKCFLLNWMDHELQPWSDNLQASAMLLNAHRKKLMKKLGRPVQSCDPPSWQVKKKMESGNSSTWDIATFEFVLLISECHPLPDTSESRVWIRTIADFCDIARAVNVREVAMRYKICLDCTRMLVKEYTPDNINEYAVDDIEFRMASYDKGAKSMIPSSSICLSFALEPSQHGRPNSTSEFWAGKWIYGDGERNFSKDVVVNLWFGHWDHDIEATLSVLILVTLSHCRFSCNFYGLTEKNGCKGLTLQQFKTSLPSYFQGSSRFNDDNREKIALNLTWQLFRALAEVHAIGSSPEHDLGHGVRMIIMRNITPWMLGLDEQEPIPGLFFADFGAARLVSSATSTCPESWALDGLEFMSPEGWNTPPGFVQKSDVWSAACCAIYIFCGESPFYGSTEEDIRQKVTGFQRHPLPDNIPVDLRSLLMRCLSPTADNRPSAEFMEAALNYMTSTYEHMLQYHLERKGEADCLLARPSQMDPPPSLANYELCLPQGNEVAEWLLSRNLQHFTLEFVQHKLETLSLVTNLNDDEISSIYKDHVARLTKSGATHADTPKWAKGSARHWSIYSHRLHNAQGEAVPPGRARESTPPYIGSGVRPIRTECRPCMDVASEAGYFVGEQALLRQEIRNLRNDIRVKSLQERLNLFQDLNVPAYSALFTNNALETAFGKSVVQGMVFFIGSAIVVGVVSIYALSIATAHGTYAQYVSWSFLLLCASGLLDALSGFMLTYSACAARFFSPLKGKLIFEATFKWSMMVSFALNVLYLVFGSEISSQLLLEFLFRLVGLFLIKYYQQWFWMAFMSALQLIMFGLWASYLSYSKTRLGYYNLYRVTLSNDVWYAGILDFPLSFLIFGIFMTFVQAAVVYKSITTRIQSSVQALAEKYDKLWGQVLILSGNYLDELESKTNEIQCAIRKQFKTEQVRMLVGWSRVGFVFSGNVRRQFSASGKYLQQIDQLDELFAQARALNFTFQEQLKLWCPVPGKFIMGPVKHPERAIQKIVRKYRRDVAQLTDCVRCTVVFDTVKEVLEFLDWIEKRSCIGLLHPDEAQQFLGPGDEQRVLRKMMRIVGLKNRLRAGYCESENPISRFLSQPWTGYRDLSINCEVAWEQDVQERRICCLPVSDWDRVAKYRRVERHVCEVQVLLSQFYEISNENHGVYVDHRNSRTL